MRAARRLARRAARDETGALRVEGRRAVLTAIEAGADVTEVFVCDAPDVADAAAARGIPVVPVTERVLAALSDVATPQGVVAVARSPHATLADVARDARLALVLADVRDPGNAGTLVRSAAAAGAAAVVFARASVDPFHPKTVRATAGTLFRVPIVRAVDLPDALGGLRRAGLRVVGADARAPSAWDDGRLDGRVALVVGNEAWGIGDEGRTLLDDVVGIPMPGAAESLNVGIAGSILLFEAVRRARGAS